MPASETGYDEPAPAAYAWMMVTVSRVMLFVTVIVVFLSWAVRVLHAGLTFLVAGLRGVCDDAPGVERC